MRFQFRQTIFVACEGSSERGYIRWIDRLARFFSVPVAITAEDMKGGSAIQIVRKSVNLLQRKPDGRKTYQKRFLLLDFDLSANTKHELDQAAQIAEKNSIRVIWQMNCHECFLLKHFPETENRNPTTASSCNDLLLSIWSAYRKGQDAIGYENRMAIEHLARGRANLPDLDAFLNDIGWN